MALSSRSPAVAHAHLLRKLPLFSSAKPRFLLLKRPSVRNLCLSASTVNEDEVSEDNSLSKDPDRASWLQPNAISDPFFGWISDNSQQNHSTKTGWIKIGGIGILAIGIALGAQAMYFIQANRSSTGSVSVIEHVLSPRKQNKSRQSQGSQGTNRTNGNKDLQIQEAPVKNPEGKVLVSAPVDRMQEQFMAALRALKVIEASAEAGDICRRRDYARWLIVASARLSRSPAHTVFPAMYIEGVTKTAYADVPPEDKDFPYIQGLAEAGLISSRLLQDVIDEEQDNDSLFKPDSPLNRQDLVAWKMALERNLSLSRADATTSARKALKELSGFVDINLIRPDVCAALVSDIRAGERGITALAFGYTRRFQPEKPVTKVQAAVALATGDAWELVSEELVRLEADSIAEAAVATELVLETKAQRELAASFNVLLEAEKAKQHEAVCLVGKLEAQLEIVKAQYEEEKFALLKDRAELDCEKTLLSNRKRDLEQQALDVSSAELDVSFQKKHVDKLRTEVEVEKEKISNIRAELEVEKSALNLARAWAEDEAKRALTHSSLLQQARKRWEHAGVRVRVEKELDDENIPGPNWQYSDGFKTERLPSWRLLERSNNFIQQLKNALLRFVHLVVLFCQGITHQSNEFAQGFIERIHEVKAKWSHSTANWHYSDGFKTESSPSWRLLERSNNYIQQLKNALLRFVHLVVLFCQGIIHQSNEFAQGFIERIHEVKAKWSHSTANAAAGVKRTLPSVTRLTTLTKESTSKAFEQCKGGAERLLEKLKVSQ